MNASRPPLPRFEQFLRHAPDAACFLFFALSLSAPSGYSYGSAALALLTLIGLARARPATAASGETRLLVATLMLMGALWCASFDAAWSWAGWGYGAKYALAALSLWYLSRPGAAPEAVAWGSAAGGLGSFCIAAYQYQVLGLERVWGFTNAIEYGGIAMYLGIAAWCLALLGRRPWPQSLALGLCGAAAMLASLLSESRGSWIVLPLLIAAIWCMAWVNGHRRMAMAAVAAMLIGALALFLAAHDKLEQRASIAVQEVEQYLADPAQYAETSVGQRLEQWRLAERLIEQRPLRGWGIAGYRAAKQAMVDAGQAHPSVMQYGHAHNEILDMWAKRGLPGLVALLLFYAIPLYAFWPTPRRLARAGEDLRPRLLALRAAAALLPLAYFGFGWTQVFFAHNSGNMFYIFSLVALWGAICRLESGATFAPASACRKPGLPASPVPAHTAHR